MRHTDLSRVLSAALLCAMAGCHGEATGTGGDLGLDHGVPTDLGSADLAGADLAQENCVAPQVLILLDRTGTMHRDVQGNTPPDTSAGHASAKLTQAIDAVKQLVSTSGLDESVRFGLALFPKDPGTGCLTLTERLQGMLFTNPTCQEGQVVVPPDVGEGAAISGSIDPETTKLCLSTPTGAGLQTVYDELRSIAIPGVPQYVMLVTDGADFYASCPTPDPLDKLRELDDHGIKTYIVGFGSQDTTTYGTNPPLLNRMACAGHTAKGFATACQGGADGGYDAVNADGGALYYDATDPTSLEAGLRAIAQTVCCDCVL